MKKFGTILLLGALLAATAAPALATEAAEATGAVASTATGGGTSVWFYTFVSIATAIGMSITAIGVGLAQSGAVKGAVEGIARNPGASGKVFSTLIIGLAMMESLAIYALVVALILLLANPFLKFVG
jgi:F-type H+-transporting ATPase subunit c